MKLQNQHHSKKEDKGSNKNTIQSKKSIKTINIINQINNQDKVRTKIEEKKNGNKDNKKLTSSSGSYLTSGNLAKDYL